MNTQHNSNFRAAIEIGRQTVVSISFQLYKIRINFQRPIMLTSESVQNKKIKNIFNPKSMKVRPIICLIIFMLLSIELVSLHLEKTPWHKNRNSHKNQNQIWNNFNSRNSANNENICYKYSNLRTSIIQLGFLEQQNSLNMIVSYQRQGRLIAQNFLKVPPVSIFQNVYAQPSNESKYGASGIQIRQIKNKNYIISITFDNGSDRKPFGLACIYPKSKYHEQKKSTDEPEDLISWFNEDADWAAKYSNKRSLLSTNCILLNDLGAQQDEFKQYMSATINGFKFSCQMEYRGKAIQAQNGKISCAALRMSCLILNA